MQHDLEYNSIGGVVGGTLLSISQIVPFTSILSTIILAVIGASTSFFVTAILRWIIKKIFKNKPDKYYPPNGE